MFIPGTGGAVLRGVRRLRKPLRAFVEAEECAETVIAVAWADWERPKARWRDHLKKFFEKRFAMRATDSW